VIRTRLVASGEQGQHQRRRYRRHFDFIQPHYVTSKLTQQYNTIISIIALRLVTAVVATGSMDERYTSHQASLVAGEDSI
jgi:hypothetical protein